MALQTYEKYIQRKYGEGAVGAPSLRPTASHSGGSRSYTPYTPYRNYSPSSYTQGAGLSADTQRAANNSSAAGYNSNIRNFLDTISAAEGTTRLGYNEVLGSGAYGRPSQPLTDMTLQQVYDYGRSSLGPNYVSKTGNKMSTASGRYQIVGTTMLDMAKQMGLDPNTTKFTPEVQDAMALQIYKNQGIDAWAGFGTGKGKTLKAQALASIKGLNIPSYSGSATPQANSADIAQLQETLNGMGFNLKVDGIMGPRTHAALKQAQMVAGVQPGMSAPPATTTQLASRVQSVQPGSPQGAVPASSPLSASSATDPRVGYSSLPPILNSTGGPSFGNQNATFNATPRPVPTVTIQGSPLTSQVQTPSWRGTYSFPSPSGVRSVPTSLFPTTTLGPGAVPIGAGPPIASVGAPAALAPVMGSVAAITPVAPPTPTTGIWGQITEAVTAAIPDSVKTTAGRGAAQLNEALRTIMQNASGNSYTGSGYGGSYASAPGGGYARSGYTGGVYGGAAGRSITEGVGGAYKNR